MSFKDIKGQEKPIQILKGYIKESRMAGSYLFVGPEGVGKNLTAKTLAKTLNCFKENLDCCDECSSCLKIDKNEHPDIRLIDNLDSLGIKSEASCVIRIESIRDLQKNINLRPYEARKKVFIINNAHNLTAEASNALLKILEEPPQDSLIILVSAKPALLFKTVISRCKIIKFYPLKKMELKGILKKDYYLDNDLAHFLAYFSEGRMGCALKLKDKDILREKNKVIDELCLFGKQISLKNLPIQNRENIRNYLNILATWYRDMYLLKIGLSHSELINFDRKEELLKLMSHYTLFDLDEILNFISNSLLYLEQNINIKLLLSNLKFQLWKGRF